MVVHVAVDLHAEEMRGQEHAGLAVPGGQAGHRRIGRERAPGVLVHPDRDRQVVLAGLDGPGGHGHRGACRRAAVEHAAQRHPGQPQPAHDGIGVVDLQAAHESRLDLRPADPGVIERGPDRFGGHVHRGLAGESAERVQPDADDHRFHHASPGVTGGGAPREQGGLGDRPPGYGRERERHDLRAVGADGVGHDRQPHRLADGQPGRVGFGQPGLDHDLAGQLDVAQRVRPEGLGGVGAVVGRARRPEILRGERPQRAPVRQQRLGGLGPAAPLAGRPGREPDQTAARAPRPDQAGLVRGPGEQAFRHWNLPGSGHRRAPAYPSEYR